MKLSKITSIVVLAIVSILALTISANAYTSAELSEYVTGAHLIGGYQYKLTDGNSATVKDYLSKNPVTDAQAAQIKSILDQAKAKANGYTDLSQISDAQIAELIAILQQAGAVAGLTVNVNTQANIITVSKNGTVLLNGPYVDNGNGGVTVKFGQGESAPSGANTPANGGSKTFVYTGSDYSVFAGIALVAVVAVSTIYVRKVYAK